MAHSIKGRPLVHPHPFSQPITKIIAGNGIDVITQHNGDTTISTISPYPPKKPIFMIGLPSTTSPDEFEGIGRHLDVKLHDYHVLVLRNTTDTYTAKLFSERGEDTLPISDIKKYINQKLK